MASQLKKLTATAWTQLTTGSTSKTLQVQDGVVLVSVTDTTVAPVLDAPAHIVKTYESMPITQPTIAWARASGTSAALVIS